ncbi:hypothetical protein MASR2M44_14000 [Bacteroidota bacterium]
MIYIIGTGPMAQSYAKVFVHLGNEFSVIGRGRESAASFCMAVGIQPFIGGIDAFLINNQFSENDSVVIATGTEALMPALRKVLEAGAGRVLIEKPAAISIEELLENEEFLMPFSEKVFVAYNRRFYATVIEARKLIEEDGGLESMHFEFTEWAHKIEQLEKARGVKENWFFANSTHVIDLAFFISGQPEDWCTYAMPGKLNWHKNTKFTGAGITKNKVMFSYHSNWESAGRWGLELNTYKRKIILRPLEEIQIQWKGTVQLEYQHIDLSYDNHFKPGLFLQTKAFLNNDAHLLCSLGEQICNARDIYHRIINP